MLLLADSGSTKCDWILANDDFSFFATASTRGLNPLFVTDELLSATILSEPLLASNAGEIKQVYFFGSGVSGMEPSQRVKAVLRGIFQVAQVYVANDVEASAIATYSGVPGLSCILGTGSNVSFFDGKRYREGLPSLGYILGDEGAGVWIGKQLVTDFFYRRMPKDLAAKMEDQYSMIRPEVINSLYREPDPNRYLASFAAFAGANKKHTYIENLVYEGFELFIQTHVLFYEESSSVPVHFTGSIAHNFSEILLDCLDKNDLEAGNIIEKPGKRLLEGLKNLNS